MKIEVTEDLLSRFFAEAQRGGVRAGVEMIVTEFNEVIERDYVLRPEREEGAA